MRPVHGLSMRGIHLPDIVAAIGMSESAGKNVQIGMLTHIESTGCSEVCRVEAYGMIFIE
jgi:hypothetical protein